MALQDARDQVDGAITRDDRRGLTFENAFGGATSIFRRRYTKDLAGYDLAVTGVPFDQAVTHRPGARFGPRAIREASALQPFDPPYGWDGFSPLDELAIADYGDVGFDYARVADFPGALRDHVAGILAQGAGCIAMGGDHYVSFPILQAHAAVHGPLSLIHFDAHSDTWPDDDMDRIDHGTMFYKAVRTRVIDPASSVQIGIRTVNPDPLGVTTIDARAVHEAAPGAVARRIRKVVGDRPCYLTFDIDCLDPAFAPGTGTPVWGGLSSGQAAAILRDLAGINLVGGDVVEVSPPYDTTGATAIAGAHVVMELICLWGWTRRAASPAGQASG
jgi:agmatinase